MSTEQNKATLRRYYSEIFNKGNFSLWNELVDPNYIMHGTGGGELKGLEAAKQGFAQRKVWSSDLQVSYDEMVAEGDTVVVRGEFKGTNTGEFQGIQPTGKKFTRAFAAFYYFKNGKIAEGWTVQDVLGMYQQLGITPPAAQPAAAGR